ncbi:hypothetical protein KKC59_00895 [bacterium]|nr:hypothetical protein [bacterium]
MKSWKIVFCSLLIFFCGCASTQTLSNLQRRSIEAKIFKGSYDNAYHATLQVLQDYGYVIKHTEYASGVIVGELGSKADANWFWTGNQQSFQVTVNIEKWSETEVSQRITFVEKIVNAAWKMENNKIVEQPELLQKIYDDIQKEIFIRENLEKK